ncbi:hypothetical protein [Ideonella sp. A 288]|uniref:hypothetical protein n=1 Tax=Ideonella sp. A 288 TaxID=1962181 RepID=UPI000B4B5021|nr:hypothetical protein [Ideonella sp. A 288]
MIESWMRKLVVGLSVAACALGTSAGVVEIPGTEGVLTLLGTNDRGDLLWSPRSGGLRMSTRDAAGTYTHLAIDAAVMGKGWAYTSLAANGDAVWLGIDSAGVQNIYYYDATTKASRALTIDAARYNMPQIGGNGNAAWPSYVPLCNGCADGAFHIYYLHKASGQITRLSAAAQASLPIAMNARGDAYWFERAADGTTEIRRHNATTRVTTVAVRRPAGTGGRSIAVSDFGELAWTEGVAGTSQVDVFAYDPRGGGVRRITNTPAEDSTVRINAIGDLVWRVGPQVWQHDRRAVRNTMIGANGTYGGNYAMNDLGEVAWSKQLSDYVVEMHFYKRATAGDVAVRPGQPFPMEGQPAVNAAGDVFYVTSWGTDWLQSRIVRATRDFICN